MNRPDGRLALRRANPFVMLAVGALGGALLVGLVHQPAHPVTVASGSAGPAPVAAGSSDSAGSAPAAGSAAATTPSAPATSSAVNGATAPAVVGAPTSAPAVVGPSSAPIGARPTTKGHGHPTTTAACKGTASAQGVTATSVKVGFALPDLGALKALVNIGDPQKDIEAALAGMRKDGLLPVCGRDISPVFRTFNVLDPSQSRAACDGFADDDKVFAVVSLFAFSAAECVTTEKHLFLLDQGTAVSESAMAASPLLYTTDPPLDAQLRNAAYWAVKSGALEGKTIGVYYNQNGPGGADPPGAAVKNDLINTLAQLGHPVKDVVVSSTQLSASAPTASDPYDRVAVQRFKADGIQVVFPLEFSSDFFQQAQLQGYHAQWMVYGTAMSSDAVTSTYPASSLDGALGLLWEHVGETKAGVPPSAQTTKCFGYYSAAGGTPPSDPESAQGQTLRESCDPVLLFSKALAVAGANLTEATMAAAMQATNGVTMSYYSVEAFTPTKHWGATQNGTVGYHSDCSCWKSTGPFVPVYWRP